jgi:hypothetical protein
VVRLLPYTTGCGRRAISTWITWAWTLWSTKGLIDIGKFPDPDERLAHAFEVARELVSQESGIPPDKKMEMLDTMSKMIGLFNNATGLGEAFARGLGPHVGSS